MGVPGLAQWLVAQCPSAHSEFPIVHTKGSGTLVSRCEHLYIDAPHYLHTCIRGATSRKQVYAKLFHRLDATLRSCSPSKSIVIAMDGVAPLAKLLTQRHRRQAEDRKGGTALAPKAATEAYMGRPGLTPGCLLLAEIQDALTSYVASRLATGRYPGVHIELSGADVPGEAELKLLDRMMRPWAGVQPADRHIVVAGDSDLALMACFLPASTNVSLLREYVVLKKTSWKLFSMAKLASKWQQQHAFMQGDVNMQAAKRDMAFLAVIGSGNDYVPCIHPSTERMWPAYLKLRQQDQWHDRHLVHLQGSSVSFDAQLLSALMQQLYHGHDPSPARDTLSSLSRAGEYLEGVRWVLEMYAMGACEDWRYSFEHKAPGVQALQQYLQEAIALQGHGQDAVTFVPPVRVQQLQEVSMRPVSPTAFAMSLLGPKLGQKFAPSALQHLMQPPSPIAHLYRICNECDTLRAAEKSSQLALAQARKAEEAGKKAQLSPEQQDQLRSKVHSLQSRVRTTNMAWQSHTSAAHPHERFPIDSVEAAVAAVAPSEYPAHERRLLDFRTSYCYWAMGHTKPSLLTDCSPPHKDAARQHIHTPPSLSSTSAAAATVEQRRLHRMTLPTPSFSQQDLPLKWEHVTVDVLVRNFREGQQRVARKRAAASYMQLQRARAVESAAVRHASQGKWHGRIAKCLRAPLARQPRLALLL